MNKHIHINRFFSPFHKKTTIVMLLLTLFPVFFILSTSKAQAATSFSISNYSQGATLTEKYFVFTTCSGGCTSFNVVRCNRPDGNQCKSISFSSNSELGKKLGAKHKPSSMYHSWGTDYAQVILKENKGMYCIKLSTMKSVAKSKCGPMVKSNGLNYSGDNKGVRQGWAKYGKCYIRGYGNNGGMNNYIQLYNSSKNKTDQWKVPHSGGEIEDVMMDADGRVWYTYAVNRSKLYYYKMDNDKSNKWKEKCDPIASKVAQKTDGGTTSPSSSSSSSSSSSTYETPESKYDGSVDTIFFGHIQDDGNGCGVFMILNLIIDILTFGIAIAATIGVAVSGITYLTAKDNEQQTTKAKRRIYEIVIGLVTYAVLYVALKFLLPGGFNPNQTCAKTIDTTISQQKTA